MNEKWRGLPSLLLALLLTACGGGGKEEPTPPTPPGVSTSSLPWGTTGVAYSATLSASGGTTPYSWSVSAGSLPAGLSLAAATGIISGTPAAAGSSSFTVRVADASSPQLSAMKDLSITVVDPLAVTTASLADATINVAYTATLAASGGTTPYSWSLASGTLPAGLALGSTGAVSGTPTAVGTSTFTVRVTDSSTPARTQTRSLSITVQPPPGGFLAIITTAMPLGTTGAAYALTLQATGGTAPRTWSVAGGYQLPPGLTLNQSTGAISGTPTTQGVTQVSFQVTDSSLPPQADYALLNIEIRYASTLTATTSSLPLATAGQAYSTQLEASGGTAPYAWSVTGGYQLPPGLTLNQSTGTVSGTPTTQGVTQVSFQVTDSSLPPQADYALLAIFVDQTPVFRLTTSRLPTFTVGQSYAIPLQVENGTPPYTWSVASGSLPTGLGLDPSTGVVSGTPDTMGSFSVQIQVSDSSSPAQTSAVVIFPSVRYPSLLAVTTSRLPTFTVGQSYAVPLQVENGTSPYTWSVVSGSLPTGLGLDPSTGVVSGTPDTMGSFSVQIQASDSSSPAQTSAVIIFPSVRYPSLLAITTARLPPGTEGTPYDVQLRAEAGTPPYTWSVASGDLPGGLSLDPASGVVSGTPTTMETTTVQVQASDSSSPAQAAAVILYSLVRYQSLLTVTTAHLPLARVGVPYSVQLSAGGGTPPYTWSLASGTLPAGLALDAATGVISGTPSAPGSSSIQIQASDASSPAQQAAAILYPIVL